MITLKIDGKEYQAEPNKTIIEVARENGIHIPHFCWHPKLSVSGNCRMCLVEVEKVPKLVIACATKVADGMIVHTANARVIKAREAVMEFLLINHPLDCPICDEAGECKLQDYAYKYSKGYSRFEEEKVRKPKRVSLGPNVMLDVERCIMCSRCIRFCAEIANSPQLVFTKRGDKVELTTAPGEILDNPYSMNVVDICPVGALTSKDFRFKARVWEMSATESICRGCARGCNINIWVRNNEILRLTPRYNPEVNEYWMCDHGRLNTFKYVNSSDRLKSPMIVKEGELVDVSWEEAIAHAVFKLKNFKKNEIAGIGSAFATNEDNYLFAKFIKQVLGSPHLDFMRHISGEDDNLLIRADKTPNSLGALAVGVKPGEKGFNFGQIMDGINSGMIKCLYVLCDDIAISDDIINALSKIDCLIVNSPIKNNLTSIADIVFPSATYAEKDGTFTNFQGRVQRIRPAIATAEVDRVLDGLSQSRLDKFGAPNDRWTKGIRIDARPSWRIISAIATTMNYKFKYNSAEEIFNEISQNVEAFKGLNYLKIGKKGAMLNLESIKDHKLARV